MRGTAVAAAVAVGCLSPVIGALIAGSFLVGGGSSATVLIAMVPFVVAGAARPSR